MDLWKVCKIYPKIQTILHFKRVFLCQFHVTFISVLCQFYTKRPLRICNNFFEHGFDPPPLFWTMLKKKEQNWSGMASLIAEVQCKSRWMTARGNRGNWRNMPTLCKDIIDQNFWGHLVGDCRNCLTCLWLLWPRDWEEATSRFWWLALEQSRDAMPTPAWLCPVPTFVEWSQS